MFTEPVLFHAPPGFTAAIKEMARKSHMTRSEYLRRSALEKLERDGVRLPAAPATVRERRAS